MNSNFQVISSVVDFIDENLFSELSLEAISDSAGYSKYHLHRMFTGIVGLPIYTYIKRRKLTEAARQLIYSDRPILEIALKSGYESQQAFSDSFKKLFRKSPARYRKKNKFTPLQLKFTIDENIELSGDRMIEITEIKSNEKMFLGYTANTAKGFWVIGQCHGKLEKVKFDLAHRTDAAHLLGLNDYTNFALGTENIAYDYTAAVEVSTVETIPEGMIVKTLPTTKYLVFSFRGKKKASTQHIAEYVYRQWFPQTTYRFNENAMYDFFRYGEADDEKGNSSIEYWVPIEG